MSTPRNVPARLRDPEVLLSILDNLPTSIFVKDQDLKFVYSNNIHCEMIGKVEDELRGWSDSDFYSAEVAKGFIDRDSKVIASGEISVAEEQASRRDGMTRPVLTRKAKLEGPDGKTYLIGTNSDLTEIKKREEQYRALAETVPVGVMQIEESGEIGFANLLGLVYLGLDGQPPHMRTMQELFGSKGLDFPGMAGKFEIDIHVSNGPLRRVLVISSGWLKLSNKHKRSAMISIVDVSEMTELRRVNDEVSRLNLELADNMKRLKDAQDELVKRGRLEQLGQLTATVAHELRNPLGAVRTSSYLLERKLAGKELGVDVQLKRISNGISRCDSIITQLLDFSRSKQLVCKPENLDMWLEAVIAEEAKKISTAVEVRFAPGLNGAYVPFDPQRLQRAVVNMLSNASEAMVGTGESLDKHSTTSPCISIATRAGQGFVQLEVRDNGPGIPVEILAKIREPLFTTKSFGTGLGVPAIEQIAIQHGGTLHVTSVVGEGAVFTVQLPLAQQTAEAA
jgi:PAS domain S-box-containing protein